MLPLHTFCKFDGEVTSQPLKVLSLKEALGSHIPFERVALNLNKDADKVDIKKLTEIGFSTFISDGEVPINGATRVFALRNPEVVNNGDVIRIQSKNGQLAVLFRRGANANSLFVTERCNSKCIMCSQPPTLNDDQWLTDEILSFIPLLDRDMDFLGITGGEPTLLGNRLVKILESCAAYLPDTKLHILTNGRNFADPAFCQQFSPYKDRIIWAIPLYSDIEHIHDYVVQSRNAYNETINGIYNLAEIGQRIEIRMVLQKETVPRLKEYVEFIYRNFSFIDHLALMGLEPMGFAKMNYDEIWCDPATYGSELVSACQYLENLGMPVSIYNTPLCLLPKSGWRYARQSISDWKNTYLDECSKCLQRDVCCGFFSSVGDKWKSPSISAIIEA